MPLEKSTLDDLRIRRDTPKKRSFWPFLLLGILLLVIAATAGGWWLIKSRPLPVRIAVARENTSSSGPKTLLNGTGYVTPRREATVSSKVTGKVVEVFIEEGMKVQEGQILARLDDSNVLASFKLAEVQLTSAKAALNEIRVRLREAELDLNRTTDLARNKIATQADLDHAEAEFNSTKARLEHQEVEVSVAERQVALWKQQVEDNVIRAPFSGVVTSKNAQPGEMISPISAGGGFTRTGICTIVDMDSLEIEVEVNESYINRVEAGQAVEATLDSYPDWKIPCKVIAIIPTADRQKATVKVRVAFEKLDARILPQMGVKVAFQGPQDSPASKTFVTIPKVALRRENNRDIVFVLDSGRAERRAITLGSANGDEASIVAGLRPGEKLILDPPADLKPGAQVREIKP